MSDANKDLIQHHGVTFVPAVHGRLEFGLTVRRIFHHLQPDAVAIELPPTIQAAVEKGVDRLPQISVVLYEEEHGQTVYLPLEPQDPLIEAARLAREHGVPLYFIDRDTENYPRNIDPLPDSYTVARLGLAAYAKAYAAEFENAESGRQDQMREMTMAFHLQDIAARYERPLCVLGLAHYPAVVRLMEQPSTQVLGRTKRKGVTLANLDPESCREIMSEMPYFAAAFVRGGENEPGDDLDRLDLLHDLLDEAKTNHLKNSKDEISPAQMLVLNKFARNYAIIKGRLTPDFYQLLIAARGAVDDNFAYEVWELAGNYPWQQKESDLPTLRLRGEDLFLDTKQIRFYRRFKQFRRRLAPVKIKQRPKERKPGEWKENWTGFSICSHQPEDIIVEGFGDYAMKKTLQVLSLENSRVQPFETSMLDGIDIRETIRNWHEKKIYVREARQERGKVGSVVVIFDEDRGDERGEESYPWKMTWLGEHAQESDMAFYATTSGDHVIGPGISRCEYGGFMLSYPPMRMYDIWKDTFFDGARTKSERLLLAGIDYSEEKLITYIAAKPPPERMKSRATSIGKKVVYLPIGQFSPVTIKKMRIFHVLDGHHVRMWANDYIF